MTHREAWCMQQEREHDERMEQETPGALTKEQREVEHMMTCRNKDCRRCNG